MQISKLHQRTILAANKKIEKMSERSELLTSYFNGEVIEDSYRTYRNIFHKIIIKIALCFCGNEKTLFKLNQKRAFLEELDTSINKIKNDYKNQGSLIRAYTSNAEKSDVLIMFKDFFKGYKSYEVEVKGDYLNVYFVKDGYFDNYNPDFYISIFIELDTRRKYQSGSEISKKSHTSPLFTKNDKPEMSSLKIESPRSDDSGESSEVPKKQVMIKDTIAVSRSSSNLAIENIQESPTSSKHSASTYETIPIDSHNKIDFDFLYAIKTHQKAYFENAMILEKLEISDKNLLRLRNEIHKNSFIKKDNELKITYLVYLLNLLTLRPEEVTKRRNEFVDGIYLLKAMQPNILNSNIELNFSYWLMIEHDLMPHTVVNIREYFLLICRDTYLIQFLKSLMELDNVGF